MSQPNATPLFVQRFGNGRPLLCLHGIEAHGLRFVGLAARLSNVEIVAPDLRGHGHSPGSGPWTVAQHMADLAPLLDSLGTRTVVLGHSYGGLIAWELARSMPGAMAGLVLADPAIGVTAATAEEGIAANAARLAWADERAALEALLALRSPGAWWAAALEYAAGLGRTPDGRLRPVVREEAVDAGWAQMREPIRESHWRGPTLLLEAGLEKGKYISAATAAVMRESLGQNLRHEVLEVTHTIPSDHPELLADLTGALIQRLG